MIDNCTGCFINLHINLNKNDRSFNISSNSKERPFNFFKFIDFNIQKIQQIELKQLEIQRVTFSK